jgi:hypothetical protein
VSGSLGMIRLAISVGVAPLPCVVIVQVFRRSDSCFCCMWPRPAVRLQIAPCPLSRLTYSLQRLPDEHVFSSENGRVDVHDTVCGKALVDRKWDCCSASPDQIRIGPRFYGCVSGAHIHGKGSWRAEETREIGREEKLEEGDRSPCSLGSTS